MRLDIRREDSRRISILHDGTCHLGIKYGVYVNKIVLERCAGNIPWIERSGRQRLLPHVNTDHPSQGILVKTPIQMPKCRPNEATSIGYSAQYIIRLGLAKLEALKALEETFLSERQLARAWQQTILEISPRLQWNSDPVSWRRLACRN